MQRFWRAALAVLCLLALSTAAAAKAVRPASAIVPLWTDERYAPPAPPLIRHPPPGAGAGSEVRARRASLEGRRPAHLMTAHELDFAKPAPAARPEPIDAAASRNIFARYALAHAGNAPTDRLPKVLQAKLAEIQNACPGFRVTSTVCGRRGHSWNVAGTGHPSLHCSNQAADFQVRNYSCAYAHLRDWRGGLSGDPRVVKHVHISTGSREGRFCHHGRYDARCMFARARPRHYGRHHYAGA